jgi:hypothetical protein
MSLFRPYHNGDPVRDDLLAKCRYAQRHFNFVHYQRFELDDVDEEFLQSLDDEELFDLFDMFIDAVYTGPQAPQAPLMA